MDNAQYTLFHNAAPSRDYGIGVADLNNRSDRTLLYGYDVGRDSFHVYLRDGLIHLVKYRSTEPPHFTRSDVFFEDGHDLVPNKRVYPESCDFEFFCALRVRGIPFAMRNFDPERAERLEGHTFHGAPYARPGYPGIPQP